MFGFGKKKRETSPSPGSEPRDEERTAPGESDAASLRPETGSEHGSESGPSPADPASSATSLWDLPAWQLPPEPRGEAAAPAPSKRGLLARLGFGRKPAQDTPAGQASAPGPLTAPPVAPPAAPPVRPPGSEAGEPVPPVPAAQPPDASGKPLPGPEPVRSPPASRTPELPLAPKPKPVASAPARSATPVRTPVQAPPPRASRGREGPRAEPATPRGPTGEIPVWEPLDIDEPPEVRRGIVARLRERLSRSRSQLGSGLGNLLLGRKRIDDELMEDLETLLLTADVGVEATARIVEDLAQRVKRRSLSDPQALIAALRAELREILINAWMPVRQAAPGRPQVVLMVGVNGAGKTTTIGKLAKRLQEEGNSVMLAAGDTFRAAAVEQLAVWGERNRVPVIAQHSGADSASVCFDALQAATARGIDVLIADTAGRLHTKTNLMDELAKIARVMKKIDPEAPHEVLLVVDATTGQNALSQAIQFHQAVGLTGIALTKLDGTAKGGIVFAIAERLKVPIRFIGVGESIEDLRPFDPDELLDALLG